MKTKALQFDKKKFDCYKAPQIEVVDVIIEQNILDSGSDWGDDTDGGLGGFTGDIW